MWEWRGAPPKSEMFIEALKSLPPTWGIEIADYSDYVLPMTKNTKEKDEKGKEVYVPITRLYMQAAGRIKMINDGAEQFGWKVGEAWEIVHNNPFVIRAAIEITPLIAAPDATEDRATPYGVRFGLSKLKGGDNAWEKAETQARGRALGAWGFGVIPGSGIASFEEMQDVGTFEEGGVEPGEEPSKLSRQDLIDRLLDLRAELSQVRGTPIEELDQGLKRWMQKRWSIDMFVGDTGPDLSALKDGQLVLMHNEMVAQLKKARADDARTI